MKTFQVGDRFAGIGIFWHYGHSDIARNVQGPKLMNFNNNFIQKFPWVLIHLVKKLIPSNLPKLIERSLVAQLQISLSIIVQYGFKVTLFSYIFDSITRTIYLHCDPYSIFSFRKKKNIICTEMKSKVYLMSGILTLQYKKFCSSTFYRNIWLLIS